MGNGSRTTRRAGKGRLTGERVYPRYRLACHYKRALGAVLITIQAVAIRSAKMTVHVQPQPQTPSAVAALPHQSDEQRNVWEPEVEVAVCRGPVSKAALLSPWSSPHGASVREGTDVSIRFVRGLKLDDLFPMSTEPWPELASVKKQEQPCLPQTITRTRENEDEEASSIRPGGKVNW